MGLSPDVVPFTCPSGFRTEKAFWMRSETEELSLALSRVLKTDLLYQGSLSGWWNHSSWRSNMNQGEDSEEGVLNAKTTHHRTKTLRWAEAPVSLLNTQMTPCSAHSQFCLVSCWSPEQQHAPQSTGPEPQPERRLELSTVSCRSNSLKDIFYAFKQRQSDRR